MLPTSTRVVVGKPCLSHATPHLMCILRLSSQLCSRFYFYCLSLLDIVTAGSARRTLYVSLLCGSALSQFSFQSPFVSFPRAMGSECVVFEGASFPTAIPSPTSSSKTLVLLGNGLYDTEIHYLQIKFYGIGAYAEADIGVHLKEWKGKKEEELLAEENGFFLSFCKAPVEKVAKLVIIKEVKGSQFVTPLQSSVRDRLAYADLYEEEEEEALDSLVEFFQKKAWFSQGSSIFLHWPFPALLQVSVGNEADSTIPASCDISVKNEHVAKGVQEWLFGPSSLSPSLLKSVAAGVLRLPPQ